MQILNIGRNNSNTIVLNDDMVSRQHAQLIIMNNAQVLIKDLGSTNGTFVNGNRIRECYLKPADIVKCAGIFLDWSQYVNVDKAEIPQMQALREVSDFDDFKTFTRKDIRLYITARIFNVGDLFSSEWDAKSTMLFFFVIPLIGTLLLGGLFFYFAVSVSSYIQPVPSLLKILLQLFAASVSIFGISQILTLSLLTIKRDTTLRKNLLASSIFSFLEFLILVVAVTAALLIAHITNEGGIIRILPQLPLTDSGSGLGVLLVMIYIAAYTLIISIATTLILFIYNYFRSIDVSRGISIHLTVLSLALCLLAQFCFFYLIIAFTR